MRYSLENRKTKNQVFYAGRYGTNKRYAIEHTDTLPGNTDMTETREKRLALPRLPWKLPKLQDSAQKRAGKNIALFLAFMLVLTMVARGTAAATLAEVTVGNTTASEIIESVSGSGIVNTSDGVNITAPADLKVEEVLVQTGQKIAEGDALIKFEADSVKEKLDKEKADYNQNEIKYNQLLQNSPQDSTGLTRAQSALAWAQQDYDDAKKAGERSVAQAQQKLNDAKTELENIKKQKTDAAARNTELNLPETLAGEDGENENSSDTVSVPEPSDSGNHTDLSAYDEQVKAAEAAVADAQSALDGAKQQADNDLKSAARAIESAKQELLSAQTSEAKTQQDTQNDRDTKTAEAAAAKLELDKQKAGIDTLQRLYDDGCILKADKEGMVKTSLSQGQKTGDDPVVTLSDTAGVYEAEMIVEKQDAQQLNVGNKVEIVENSGSAYNSNLLEGTVSSIAEPDESGQVKIRVRLPEKNWEQGQSLQMRITKKKDTYSTTVAASAVRSDSNGEFVLVVEKKSTILGEENVLVYVPVTVLSRSADVVAIEGAVSQGDKIVVGSTKPVTEHDRVRVTS